MSNTTQTTHSNPDVPHIIDENDEMETDAQIRNFHTVIDINGFLQLSIITGFGGGIMTGWLANSHMTSSIMLGTVICVSSCVLFANGMRDSVRAALESNLNKIRNRFRLVPKSTSSPPPSPPMRGRY